MKNKCLPHFIAVGAFIVFIVLGLASASGPKIGPGEASMVSFSTGGATGTVPATVTIEKDGSITIPSGDGLSYGDAIFEGWDCYEGNRLITHFKGGESFTPTGGYYSLSAKWDFSYLDNVSFDSVTGLANKLFWLRQKAESGGNYTIVVNTNESIAYQNFSYPGRNNITVTLRGNGTISLLTQGNFKASSDGTLFTVGEGVTLVLDDNITLQGTSASDRYAVVGVGGNFIMNNGSTITGNTNYTAVSVGGGTFTMNGGTITGSRGGVEVGIIGIGVKGKGTFIMNGGTITRNGGSGVIVAVGTFNMTGGTISNNIRIGDGGGVHVGFAFGTSGEAVFNMSGGNITGNEAQSQVERDGRRNLARGGGVYVEGSGRFTMTGGSITGNKANEGANGVFGSFSNRGGTVQPN
jgi:hypothetical protein